jgi:hypothetical protein
MKASIALLLFGLLVADRAAEGGTGCCSSFSTTPHLLVGRNPANSPAEDVRGDFTITVRNDANAVIPGVPVTLNFGTCSPDIVLSAIQTFPGVAIDCATKTVTVITDALGRATFRILGGANNPSGNAPGTSSACVELRGNGEFFANLQVAAIDQVGNLDGVHPNDLSVLISDINLGSIAERDDVNLDGVVNPGDLGAQITYVNQGRSAENTGSLCP